MRRIHVSSSGDGGYGRKAAQSLWGDPWKGLPDTEAEPVRLYHPYGKQDTGLGEIPAHEFHYFDSTDCGEDFHAAKPASKRGWDCIHDRGRLMAGFPHLYYYGNPRVPARFLKNALEYKKERRQKKDAEI